MSRLLIPTLREAPADAELASHQLMVRAALMRRLADTAGLYALLPLGLRVKAKVEAIIREEMDAIGGQEVQMPLVQPAELWQESGRWTVYGEEMWRLRDRHGRLYCLGPTHEEVMTDLVRHEVRSWRQLPLLLYQIQNKYRDERRPRFGLLRAREFIMKDAYSFHADEADLERCYREVFDAYARIFRRVGLRCRPVLADSGAIGGSRTHEFMALAEAGEAELVYCDRCDYAADVERAETPPAPPREAAGPMDRTPTPGATTIAAVSAALGVPPAETAKTLFYRATYADGREETVAALVPGDRELNEVKLVNATGAVRIRPALPEEVRAPLGYAGPVGLRGARLVTDRTIAAGGAWVVGANEEGYHLTGVVAGRDFDPGTVADLILVRPGDRCPSCGGTLLGARGIEVGQVFGLGTKYSSAMKAHFLDPTGQLRPMVMGCYGIGVTRTMAAIVEQHHDADGIIWPPAVAPYHCVLVPVATGGEAVRALSVAEELAGRLAAAGVEVVVDDRDERPGVKFKDADLVGLPVRVTLGRALADGQVEVRRRDRGETRLVPLEGAVAAVREALEAQVPPG
jgi:prolyl-tRNA synthetase